TNTPSGPTLVTVGNVYTYTMTGSTATNGYEQLVDQNAFPNSIFQILAISQTYAVPLPGGPDPNDQEYADGCTWDPVPGSPTYRACLGTGKAGGDPLNTTYTVLVVGAGTGTIIPLIYDFSGSSYHYNSDFGLGITV